MARYRISERKDVFSACAYELDWKSKLNGDPTMVKWLLDFDLFRSGGQRNIKPLIIQEKDDLEFTCVFDYDYTVSTGKSSVTFRQTVYFRYSKALALPHFLMVPEKWYHRIGAALGMQDIDFVEYPVFSKNYLLRGKDEDYVRYHFDHPEMMRFFDNQKFYSMEGVNYLLILYIHNIILPKEEIIRLVRIGNTLHNFFTEKTPSISLPDPGPLGV
jgi:hypothetical protein